MTLKHTASQILALFILMLSVGCSLISINGYETAEDCIDMPLPEGATDTHVKWIEFNNQPATCAVRFSLPPDELSSFIRDFGFEGELREGFHPFDNLTINEPWWNPDAAVDYAGSRRSDKYLLVDKTNNDLFIIYIIIGFG